MKEAGITSLAAAKAWLSMNGDSKLTNDSRNSIAEAFMESIGQGQKYTEDQIAYAREVVSGKYPQADPGVMAWAQQIMSETQGMKFGDGDQGANPGDQSAGYRNLDESLGRMVGRGASRDELYAEIDAEVKDGRITKEQGEALKEKYYGEADNIANSGTHANGMPRSSRYTGTLTGVRQTLDTKGKDAALQALKRALEAGYIHDYEIDYIMDELGLD